MTETGTPGSFIPHDTALAPARTRAHNGLADLLLLSGIVLLIASGALGVGVFLYGQFLQTQSASKVDQLKRAQAAFEPALIQQITRLDDRMYAASSILSTHLAPTAFFQALNQATLQTVSFSSLDLETPDPQRITVKMQGVAQSVNSIALQAELFSKSGVISSPIFSDIARSPEGVRFSLSAVVNPSALSYTQFVNAGSGAAAPALQAPQGSAPPSPASANNPFGAPQSAVPAQAPAGGSSAGQ